MKITIAKNKNGIGELDEGNIIDLFTGESVEAGNHEVVGTIQPPKYLNHVQGKLFKQRMMGTIVSEFYLLGDVSARQKLRYVRMNDTVLMGFSDNHATMNGNVYFFKKCGEIEGKSVYTYLNDMVIKEDRIEWVHAGDSPTIVPNDIN